MYPLRSAGADDLTNSQSVYGWWFGRVFVDPDNAERVFALGLDEWESTDGADSFHRFGTEMRVDQHVMAWDPRAPARLYAGNDGGLYVSDQAGADGSWSKGADQPWSQYASIDVSVQDPNRFAGGLQDNGRGRDPADPTGLPIDFDRYAERSRSIHEQRHRLVLSGAVMLPTAVQVTSIVTIGSGRPYNILAGVDFDRDGTVMDRPRRNPAAAPRDYSTAIGRNAGTTPGEAVVDVRFQRRVPLGSRAYLDAMVEVFNLFNRTNFTQVNTTWGPGAYPDRPLPTFGQFTAAGAPRQLQLAAKVGF